MSRDRLRAAVIGLGFIGAGDQVSGDRLGQNVAHLDGTHAAALAGRPRVELVAGSSRDAGRRERFQQRTGVARTYADWRELLERESPKGRPLDIVGVATYSSQHAEITEACAKAGVRAVYCEKPMAHSLADSSRMLDACRESGTLLVINHNRRFHPAFRALRDRIAAGDLGTLTSIRLQWTTGRLGNVGTHLIDSALMLTGKRIASVSGRLDLSGRSDCRGDEFHDPGAWGWMQFDNGLVGLVDGSDFGCVPFEIAVHGTKGRATSDGGSVSLFLTGNDREALPGHASGRTSMDVAVEEIVATLDQSAVFPCDASEALHTMEAIVAFHASHHRGGELVRLPLAGTERGFIVRAG